MAAMANPFSNDYEYAGNPPPKVAVRSALIERAEELEQQAQMLRMKANAGAHSHDIRDPGHCHQIDPRDWQAQGVLGHNLGAERQAIAMNNALNEKVAHALGKPPLGKPMQGMQQSAQSILADPLEELLNAIDYLLEDVRQNVRRNPALASLDHNWAMRRATEAVKLVRIAKADQQCKKAKG